jgi:acyl carrier protein
LLEPKDFRMLRLLMTTAPDIEAEIRAFLMRKAPHQRTAIEQLKPLDPIWGNVDSLLILGLVTHLEKTFKIKFAAKDFTPENLATIERVVAFVSQLAHAAEPAKA